MGDYALELSELEVQRYRMMAAAARTEEAVDWATAGIGRGAHVADIGCGPGAVLTVLADAVGPGGHVVGIDADPAAVTRARQEVADRPHATAYLSQADASGLQPASYDVVMCRHVLAHNATRAPQIVAHLAELARPGGSVVLVDVDLTGLRFVPRLDRDFDFVDRYADFHAARGGDVTIGLQLGALAEDAGLKVESFRCASTMMRPPPGTRPPIWAAREAMVAEGACTEADLARWDEAFARLDEADTRLWLFIPRFVCVAHKA